MEICQQETPNLTVSVSKHEVVCESSVVGGRDKTKMESLNREREREREDWGVSIVHTCTLAPLPSAYLSPARRHFVFTWPLYGALSTYKYTTLSPPPQMCTMAVLMETILQLGYIENVIFFNLEKLDLLYFRLLVNHEFVYIIVL